MLQVTLYSATTPPLLYEFIFGQYCLILYIQWKLVLGLTINYITLQWYTSLFYIIILFNSSTLAYGSFTSMPTGNSLFGFDNVAMACSIFFVTDVLLKLYAFSLKHYFSMLENCLDFVLSIGGLLCVSAIQMCSRESDTSYR